MREIDLNQPATLDSCWYLVDRMVKHNWRHKRRCIGLRDVTPSTVIIHMIEELGEISRAHTREGNDLEEIADLMALLFHYAQVKGFSLDDVALQMRKKLLETILEDAS
jgi:NTP pyrophosphatase (non-canonical NTP hydrolase)